jgi:predicted amidohydrolase YtcJ
VVINGRIYTVDPRQARTEACAVKNGRFIKDITIVRTVVGGNTVYQP